MIIKKNYFSKLKLGLVADELTKSCISLETNVCNVTPLNYFLVLHFWKPDILFVESAWQGQNNAWKFKIANYPDYPKRNNKKLAKVVAYAKSLGIPTVFWNKEDGVHFERFIDSAKLFDHVFTVDENCISTYKERLPAKTTVNSMLFSAQPATHFPSKTGYKYKKACFPGSYSHHIHDERRAWQDLLFSAAKPLGVTVFDRNSQRKSDNYRYPKFDNLEVRPAVAHRQTADIYRDYMVSLNVNTVVDSPTMFSRRLVEIIACGSLAVTTPAKSVDGLFY